LQANVQMLGQQSPEAIIDVLNEADVYLQYSLSEGFCNAVLEAQAMGLLCVVSDGGGLQENVLHQTTGIVVAKGRPKELAKAIKNLLHLPLKEQQAMRQA